MNDLEDELQEHALLTDTDEEEAILGNCHVDLPEEAKYMMDQFDTLYKKCEDGSVVWQVTPSIVRDWVIRYGEMRFKNGKDDAFDRVKGIVSHNVDMEIIEALEFLINEQ